MTDADRPEPLLDLALTQIGDLLGEVTDWQRTTPCAPWTMTDLAEHLVGDTRRFAATARGEKVDWTAAAVVEGDRVGAFASAADELRAAWREGSPAPVGMACAEYAVHTWDLATALRRTTSGLDAAVADVGLEFLRANLADDARGEAFAPARPAPDGADAYQRIAAFAGRRVG